VARRPNIVFVMPDQLRHDAVGYSGNPVIATPHLDHLAARGLTLFGTHAESPVCQPSRVSLMTGLFPRDHGCFNNDHLRSDFERGVPPGPEIGTFPQRLQASGYHTAVVGKMHMKLPPNQRDFVAGVGALKAFGFDDAVEERDRPHVMGMRTEYADYLRHKGLFERLIEQREARLDAVRGAQKTGDAEAASGALLGPDVFEPEDTLDGFIGQRAVQFITDYDGDEPFFLWVGFVGPHPPFVAPAAFADQYSAAEVPTGPLGPDALPKNRWGDYLALQRRPFPAGGVTAGRARQVGKYYYGKISLIDDQIGRIVAALERAGVDRDTWIVFSSDHGELLGDHGLMWKSVFYAGAVRVPTIVVPPVGSPLAQARRVDGLTQNLDVTATILDVAGCGWDRADGRSLIPAFDGRDVGRAAVFSEIAGFLMVATEDYKLIVDERTGAPQALHHLRADPDERHDVLGQQSHRDALGRLMEEHAVPFAAARVPRWRPSAPPAARRLRKLSAAVRRRG
jgi:choline-sulfatase